MAEQRQSLLNDGNVNEPSQAQLETEATRDGWRPKDQWSGSPESWIDAKTFVERGREILPIVNAKYARAESENAQLKSQVNASNAKIAELEQQFKGLQETSAEIVKIRLDEERVKLRGEIKAAREAEDVDRELNAQSKLTKLDQEPPVPKVVNEKPQVAAVDPAVTQAFQETVASNPRYQADPVFRATVGHFAIQLAKDGKLDNMTPSQRGQRIIQEANNYYAQLERPASVRRVTESGSRSAMEESRSSNGKKSFNDLPSAAREACDRQEKRIVKKGTKFDTREKWRENYVSLYYADEA